MKTTPSSALVTGASGYIGASLIAHLLQTECEIHAVIRKDTKLELLKLLTGSNYSKIKLSVYDGTIESLRKTLSSTPPKVVFHLASLFLANHKADQIEQLVLSNLLFPSQLAEVICELPDAARPLFVNVGTAWQHYQGKEYSPVALYAATKKAFEDLLLYYIERKNLTAVTLKLFDTYGPGDPRRKLLNILKEQWRLGEHATPLSMTEGHQLIDLVHITDVVEAFLAASRIKTESIQGKLKSYSVRSGQPISIRELVEKIETVSHQRIRIEWGKIPYRPCEMFQDWNTNESVSEWKPRRDLLTGLSEVFKPIHEEIAR